MKILHIIDSGGLYGAEIMLLNLIEEQIKMGLEPVICSIGEKNVVEKPVEIEAIKRGIEVETFRMAAGPNFLGALKILRYAEKETFDILHSHGYKGNILFGFMPKSMRKLPLIATVHGWTSSTNRPSKMKLYEWLDARSLKHMDKVVFVNKGMLSNPKLKTALLNNITVINNGIPRIKGINLLKDLDKGVVNFCKEGFIIGAIGRLSSEKGFNFLIDAVAELSADIPEIKLLIIGEGGERAVLEKMVSDRGIRDRVMMPGYKDTAHRYFPLFSIFVMPSLTEGLPITLLEAMQYGVRIVATEVGGIPEALNHGEAGILVKPGDSAVIAESLRSSHKRQSTLNTLGEKAKDRVLNNYSSHKMAVEYNYIYKAVVGLS